MVQIVSEFFGISGIDMLPPATFSELIPYLLTVVVGVVLAVGVLKLVSGLANVFLDWRCRR